MSAAIMFFFFHTFVPQLLIVARISTTKQLRVPSHSLLFSKLFHLFGNPTSPVLSPPPLPLVQYLFSAVPPQSQESRLLHAVPRASQPRRLLPVEQPGG